MLGLILMGALIAKDAAKTERKARESRTMTIGDPCGPGLPNCDSVAICVPLQNTCTRDCLGSCGFKYQACAGNATSTAQDGCGNIASCMMDPRFPASSGKHICVPKSVPSCGGLDAKTCKPPLKCYDNPDNSCKAHMGGKYCMGFCL